MKPVIRRILLLTFSVLVLAGCGAQERDALRVGEESISEQGLTDLVLAVSGGAPDDEEPSALSAQDFRDIGAVWLRDAAAVTYLEENGVTITQSERDGIKSEIEDAIAAQQLGAISRQSEGYEALTVNVWVTAQGPALDTPAVQEELLTLVKNAAVSSRIGKFDVETFALVPRG
jgi:hypothetical protein